MARYKALEKSNAELKQKIISIPKLERSAVNSKKTIEKLKK
jgi:hypothetical protein